MRVDIMTLFPDSMRGVLGESIIGRAAKKGLLDINCVQIRDYTDNKQCQVDDYPYGGGWGCVMMAQPLKACLDDILNSASLHTDSPNGVVKSKTRVIYMSPQGKTLTQEVAKRLVHDYDHLVLVCGHYEGIDERFIEECVDEEISIGDFVLTGGEIAAMALTDCVCRMVPGVLADEECFTGESHWDGLLEYPQYTRPEVWEGRTVPEILRSGDHAAVERWRRRQSIMRTMDKRPDMFERLELADEADRALLAEIVDERTEKSPVYSFDCRRAEAADIPAILSIVEDARAYLRTNGIDRWQKAYPGEADFLRDIERGQCWFFTCEGEAAGIITADMSPDARYERIFGGSWLTEGENYCVVRRVAVASAFRGTGLAGEMLDFAEALASGLGKQSVRLNTHEDNRPMRALMESEGYALCGRIPLTEALESLAFEKELT